MELLYRFSKKTQIPNIKKISPVGAELLHADRRTDMGKAIVFFAILYSVNVLQDSIGPSGCPILLISFSNTITNYMEQDPSSEANSSSACQKIPRISWKPKIHYRFHNRSPLDSSLSQINPLHVLTVEEHNGRTKFWSFVDSKLFMFYSEFRSKSQTHTHTHIYIYTLICGHERESVGIGRS